MLNSELILMLTSCGWAGPSSAKAGAKDELLVEVNNLSWSRRLTFHIEDWTLSLKLKYESLIIVIRVSILIIIITMLIVD